MLRGQEEILALFLWEFSDDNIQAEETESQGFYLIREEDDFTAG